MAKVLRCRDVGMDCDFEARAETEEEILKKAAEHAETMHNMKEIPVGLRGKNLSEIRTRSRLPAGKADPSAQGLGYLPYDKVFNNQRDG